MWITTIFLREHEELAAQVDELVAGARLGETGPEPLATNLTHHAQLEDELLFANLEPHLGESGPLAVMRAEHLAIEALLADLRCAPGPEAARQATADLVHLAREHFAKEEQVLFPMAEQLLGASLLTELGARHAARVASRTR
jgi:hemerythrin-like domain-containing protein